MDIDTEKVLSALRTADWSGTSIGNKAIIMAAIQKIEELADKAWRYDELSK